MYFYWAPGLKQVGLHKPTPQYWIFLTLLVSVSSYWETACVSLWCKSSLTLCSLNLSAMHCMCLGLREEKCIKGNLWRDGSLFGARNNAKIGNDASFKCKQCQRCWFLRLESDETWRVQRRETSAKVSLPSRLYLWNGDADAGISAIIIGSACLYP